MKNKDLEKKLRTLPPDVRELLLPLLLTQKTPTPSRSSSPPTSPQRSEKYFLRTTRCELCGAEKEELFQEVTITVGSWEKGKERTFRKLRENEEVPSHALLSKSSGTVSHCSECRERLQEKSKEELIELLIKIKNSPRKWR